MPITINGSGTVTGISAGGLPDDSIVTADIAAGAVTTAKVADANITAAKLDGAQSGSAPIYGARAWVNFNGAFATSPFTIANGGIRASGNVSSITDNGTGDYTVNFTTAMPDANYSVVGSSGTTASDYRIVVPNFNAAPTNSACRIRSAASSSGGPATDDSHINVAIFR